MRASVERAIGSGFLKAVDAVAADETGGLPLGLEVVQVRQGLADGEAELMRIELAPEQHGHQVERRAGLGDRVERLREPLIVVMPEILEPRVQAAEGQAVRGQDQLVLGQRAEARERVQIEPERVPTWLIRPDAD